MTANHQLVPDTGHCVTCADEGTPMTVVEIDLHRGLALCADGDGAHSTVETALVEPVMEGDCLLVHAGTAIAYLSVLTSRAAA